MTEEKWPKYFVHLLLVDAPGQDYGAVAFENECGVEQGIQYCLANSLGKYEACEDDDGGGGWQLDLQTYYFSSEKDRDQAAQLAQESLNLQDYDDSKNSTGHIETGVYMTREDEEAVLDEAKRIYDENH